MFYFSNKLHKMCYIKNELQKNVLNYKKITENYVTLQIE